MVDESEVKDALGKEVKLGALLSSIHCYSNSWIASYASPLSLREVGFLSECQERVQGTCWSLCLTPGISSSLP